MAFTMSKPGIVQHITQNSGATCPIATDNDYLNLTINLLREQIKVLRMENRMLKGRIKVLKYKPMP